MEKLDVVGLAGDEDKFRGEISGGMRLPAGNRPARLQPETAPIGDYQGRDGDRFEISDAGAIPVVE